MTFTKLLWAKKMREIRNITMNAYAMQSGKSRCDPFRNLSGDTENEKNPRLYRKQIGRFKYLGVYEWNDRMEEKKEKIK